MLRRRAEEQLCRIIRQINESFHWMAESQWAVWSGDLIASVFAPVKGLMGQTEWSQHFPACGGSSQSPVDVATTQTRFDPSLTPLTPLGYDQHGHKPFTLHNNGHTGKCGYRELSGRYPSSAAAGLFMLLHPAAQPSRHAGPSGVFRSCFCLRQLWLSSQTGWACRGWRGSSQQCRCTSTGGAGARATGAANTPSTGWVQMQRCVWTPLTETSRVPSNEPVTETHTSWKQPRNTPLNPFKSGRTWLSCTATI